MSPALFHKPLHPLIMGVATGFVHKLYGFKVYLFLSPEHSVRIMKVHMSMWTNHRFNLRCFLDTCSGMFVTPAYKGSVSNLNSVVALAWAPFCLSCFFWFSCVLKISFDDIKSCSLGLHKLWVRFQDAAFWDLRLRSIEQTIGNSWPTLVPF